MEYRFTLIPGDGIGPEVTAATREVLRAAGLRIEWEIHDAGQLAVEKTGSPLPDAVLDSIRHNRIALKGPVTTPVGKGFSSVNVGLRKALNLYACLRPVRSLPGVPSPWKDVDLVIIRENTEGLYSGLEHVVAPGVAVAVKIITREASRAIARFAFEHAKAEGRHRVTITHKASVMRLTDGLFIDTALEVAADYPFIRTDALEVDNVALQLAQDPSAFDVLLLENLFGDIVSDLGAGLVGGLGLVPGANIGDTAAVFEAVHGSAPDIAGKGRANPIALMLSAAMMLHHIGERRQAARIRESIESVLAAGRTLTPDLGGTASTMDVAAAVADALPRA
ncbi:MAG: isocitrate/isopropylmalate dehydrogenase family protein [Deltaproteobacteria bacterium]|nr:isocitrate/isopropylmalate dehydrogenase family protein [Deltaproteobacteria bacterium]